MTVAWTFSIDERGMTPPGLLHNVVISYDGTNKTITDSAAGSIWTFNDLQFITNGYKAVTGVLNCSNLKSATDSLEFEAYIDYANNTSLANRYVYKEFMKYGASSWIYGGGYRYTDGTVSLPLNHENLLAGVSVSQPVYHATYSPGGANSNTCFVATTPVNTDQGLIPIDQLDHHINTISGQSIVAISKITSTDSHLIFLKAHCLGPNQPSQDTTVSKLHKILYNGTMTAAKNLPNSNKIPYDGQPLYNVLLENYSRMTVNNLTVETLSPRANIAILYKFITTNNIDTVVKDKLIALLNQKSELTNNIRKAFFSNIIINIMLNILLEPEQKEHTQEVTPYTVLKAFLPQCTLVPDDNIRSIF